MNWDYMKGWVFSVADTSAVVVCILFKASQDFKLQSLAFLIRGNCMVCFNHHAVTIGFTLCCYIVFNSKYRFKIPSIDFDLIS